MFKGTYSTEFYRLVRDLLHAQIDAEQQSNRADARAGGTLAVAERWERLLANELAYRLENAGQSAAAASAGSTLAAGMA
jgi:anaerobic magnesium-protoporphyrin IX monomethyl ester cyclase